MDINIQANIGLCNQFLGEINKTPSEISVVIAPLKVNSYEETGKLQIINGCNMWESCFNEKCWYSKAARKIKK